MSAPSWRADVPPPLARMNMWAYGLGGLLSASSGFAGNLFRPGAWVVILPLGLGLSMFGLVIRFRGRESVVQATLATLYCLLVIAVCGRAFTPIQAQVLAVTGIPAIGVVILTAAMRLPARLVLPLMLVAGIEIGFLQPKPGDDLRATVVVITSAVLLCMVPPLAVMGYRSQLERALNRVQQLARTDPLTGLANRRGLAEGLPDLVAVALRSGRPLAVLAADLDHFKRINDELGHAVGDDVLKEIAVSVSNAVREGDLVARIGGEELCVVAIVDAYGRVDRLAERVRLAVERDAVRHRVTISVGGVEVSPVRLATGEDPIELIWTVLDRADALLYEAKEAGRNTVRVLAA